MIATLSEIAFAGWDQVFETISPVTRWLSEILYWIPILSSVVVIAGFLTVLASTTTVACISNIEEIQKEINNIQWRLEALEMLRGANHQNFLPLHDMFPERARLLLTCPISMEIPRDPIYIEPSFFERLVLEQYYENQSQIGMAALHPISRAPLVNPRYVMTHKQALRYITFYKLRESPTII